MWNHINENNKNNKIEIYIQHVPSSPSQPGYPISINMLYIFYFIIFIIFVNMISYGAQTLLVSVFFGKTFFGILCLWLCYFCFIDLYNYCPLALHYLAYYSFWFLTLYWKIYHNYGDSFFLFFLQYFSTDVVFIYLLLPNC